MLNVSIFIKKVYFQVNAESELNNNFFFFCLFQFEITCIKIKIDQNKLLQSFPLIDQNDLEDFSFQIQH